MLFRSHLIREDDREAGTAAMAELGQLKSRHIYLELLYVRWYDRFSRIGADIPVSEQENQQILEELRELPEQLPLYLRQVQRFFDLVLDRANVATTPGAGFGPSGEGYVRLTAFGDADATREAVERVKAIV